MLEKAVQMRPTSASYHANLGMTSYLALPWQPM